MTDKIFDAVCGIRAQKPLIHCITNPISINQCANVILSIGAKPIMAEHPDEVCEITATSASLMLNIGNITDVRMKSMLLSLDEAIHKNIPVLLDVVGICCSKLRREYVSELLKIGVPSLIKGNYSEIGAMYNPEYTSAGVDADTSIDISEISDAAKGLAEKYKTVIMASGKTDIITDGNRVVYVNNGVAEMADVTGTGCMLGALCTAFLSVMEPFDAAVASCAYFGICGELSVTDKGNGSYMVNMMDRISTLGSDEISKYVKLEEK